MAATDPGASAVPRDDRFWSPFELRHAPMRRLALVNIADDPRCRGVEPQVFDDPVHGTGAAVLVYRRDRTVDVYHQPGVRLDPASYAVGAGLRRMDVRPLDGFRFGIGPDGLDLEVHVVDADGMAVDVRVRERRQRAMTPLSLLAPLGGDVDRPLAMPLFFLYDFTLVPRRGTEVSIRVDGVPRAPVPFPVPLGLQRYWFLRYGGTPFLWELNPAHDGPLAALTPGSPGGLARDGVLHELVTQDGERALARLAGTDGRHHLGLEFTPAFPDAARVPDGAARSGRFRLRASGGAGWIEGRWSVVREGRHVGVGLEPAGGWHTAERGILFPLVFRAPPFRRWPDTYRWVAGLDVGGGEAPGDVVTMRSRWERTAPRR